MFKPLFFLTCVLLAGTGQAVEISGAGSTAAAPLYTKWAAEYARKTGVTLAYQGVGSSAGIKKIKESTVDFGASDAPMAGDGLKAANLIDFPTVISGVVPFVNLPGIGRGDLRLTSAILVGIYSGTILRWDDDAILAANPTLALPKIAIVPVGRSDGSGTTFTLTDFMTRVSPQWKQKYGTKSTIAWPSNVVAVKGSGEVVATAKKTVGAIGYVDYGYVIEHDLNFVQMKNHDGAFVRPNANSFRAALAQSGWEKTGNFEEMLTDKPGVASWPITGGTYVFVPRVTAQPERTKAALQFFVWAFLKGDDIANSLDYVRLPDRVQGRVFHEISSVVDSKGQRLALSLVVN
ncbi:phosphate transport system substrate-binding protein [Actimicrobium sp. GrIS 1.19]|uniref:phosphate ABC transporter substrate-binding protein PstS n=1 Tax=Actimicrobium sp. GrIS 1.19 TaxID=3071708 RepID=UPI002E034447|nr:phosphate transport system substrate-binding protein [Actimicrobium sp. GrIS 1.19]